MPVSSPVLEYDDGTIAVAGLHPRGCLWELLQRDSMCHETFHIEVPASDPGRETRTLRCASAEPKKQPLRLRADSISAAAGSPTVSSSIPKPTTTGRCRRGARMPCAPGGLGTLCALEREIRSAAIGQAQDAVDYDIVGTGEIRGV